MQIRLAVLAIALGGTLGACATPQDSASASQDTPGPASSGSYRTGSRLPSVDSQSGGDVSKDDYLDSSRRTVNPTRGN